MLAVNTLGLPRRERGTVAVGIYLHGMSNDFVDNRVANWQNTIFSPGGTVPFGKGGAWGKICPRHAPFGVWRGQVTHGGARLGLYLDNQYPRDLDRFGSRQRERAAPSPSRLQATRRL